MEAPPHNLEAEQALLGCLMFDNDSYVDVDGVVSVRDFYEPFHQRLFRAISEDIRHGRLAEPTLLASYFAIDPAYASFGGIRYLGDLVDRAPPSTHIGHYAKAVRAAALRRDVIRIASEVLDRAKYDAEADGGELMSDLEREMLAVRTGKDDLALRTWAEVSRDVVYGMDRPDDRQLIKFGFDKLDNLLGGAERGELIVLGGRPGMGKSALAACMALNIAQGGLGVAEINAEMTTTQMARRHLTDLAFARHGLDAPHYRDIKRQTLTDAQKLILAQVQQETHALPLMLVKRTGLTLGRVRAMLNRQKMLWSTAGIEMGMVVIDHVGLIKPDQTVYSRQQEQALVSGALKELAEELDVVMLALAQLNREVEKRDDKRPQLADLRDSGTWEQDADVVIGAYRDAYYARREKEPKKEIEKAEWVLRSASPEVEAIALKVREGDVGTAKLWASIGHNAIRNEAPDLGGLFI